jgi:NADH-quinone oxidoreductase subunit G
LCDEGRLSFHTLERWPRLTTAIVRGEPHDIDQALAITHKDFETIRQDSDSAIAGLGSATNTNEALFLMKKFFKGNVDFRIGEETALYQKMQDDLLRRLDKHPNTRGALDLGLAGDVGGLQGLLEQAERKELKGAWISFHPQTVGDDSPQTLALLQRLIAALELSVVSTTHDFEWARHATILLPMASWAEEKGTYTNHEGRVQITARAITPPGDAVPLHVMMVEMLRLSNIQVSRDPGAIFDWLTREVPLYQGMDYDVIGSPGAMPKNRTAEETNPAEVVR